jgi:hypothetical protein
MPYTDNREEKFDELFSRALIELRAKEANFEDELRDADLTEETLKTEVLSSVDTIWKTVEARLASFASMEEAHRSAEERVEKSVADFIATKATSSTSTQSEPSANEELELKGFRELVEGENRIKPLKVELEVHRADTDSQITKQIQELVRVAINDRLPKNFNMTLDVFRAPGLAELTDPVHMIDTSAKSSLTYMLETMEGGCIGIAGSRGAGKTTLIQMCCGEDPALNRINGVNVLPIYTTAPVQYEPRDFILYLFSAVCQRVIRMERGHYNESAIPEIEGYTEPQVPSQTIAKIISLVPDQILKRVGIVLFGVGILIAILIVGSALSSPPAPAPDSGSANQDSTNSNSAQQPGPEKRTAPGMETVLNALEIKPPPFLFWGGLLFFAGFLTQKLKEYLEAESRHDFPLSYKEYAAASEASRQEWYSKARENKDQLAVLENYARIREDERYPSLKTQAKRWLKDLKFQQSFTSGWSGALKLPIGLEGGIQRAATLSQKQMSNPEIVSAFVRFLRSVSSSDYKVVIGIDELDKMESDENAQKFLNEIKSIFGLQNCFYLISVSENAMNQFERRGLPFRDVFDSSFDNVVYVDYLNYKTAKTLIERRVIGRPIPFIYLSYCLSGGLPRDLIRNFRNLLELNQKAGSTPPGRSLDALCKEVIGGDIKAKIRAVVSATKKIETSSHSNELIEMIFELDSAQLNETQMMSTAEKLLQWRPERIIPENTDDEKSENTNRRKLEKLSDELGSYLYFLITVRQFFNAELKESVLRRSAYEGDLDQLAKSRQLLSVNPNLAVIKLNILRSKWKKDVIKIQKPVVSKRIPNRPSTKDKNSPAVVETT